MCNKAAAVELPISFLVLSASLSLSLSTATRAALWLLIRVGEGSCSTAGQGCSPVHERERAHHLTERRDPRQEGTESVGSPADL